MEKTELLNLRPEQLNPENEMVQYYAGKADIKAESLLDKVSKGREQSRFLLPGSREKVSGFQKTISDYMKNNNITGEEFQKRRESGTLSPEIKQALGGIQSYTSMEERSGLSTQELKAMSQEFVPGMAGIPTEGRKTATIDRLKSMGDRIEDKTQFKAAEGADKLRESFMNLKSEIEKLLPATQGLIKGVTENADALHENASRIRSGLRSGDWKAEFGAKSVLSSAQNAPSVSGREKK